MGLSLTLTHRVATSPDSRDLSLINTNVSNRLKTRDLIIVALSLAFTPCISLKC